MPVVPCRHCGHPVSPSSTRCPSCGAPDPWWSRQAQGEINAQHNAFLGLLAAGCGLLLIGSIALRCLGCG